MKLDSAWLKGKMAAFQADCDRLGLKVTHQRLEIYRAVVSTEEHPDVTTVHRRVRRRIPTISLDTVYRNLRLLAEHGLVSSVGMSSENARFDGNMAPHHHFVCVKCGLIRDFTAEGAGGRIPDAARAFGEPLSVHLEVKGVCVACRDGSKQ